MFFSERLLLRTCLSTSGCASMRSLYCLGAPFVCACAVVRGEDRKLNWSHERVGRGPGRLVEGAVCAVCSSVEPLDVLDGVRLLLLLELLFVVRSQSRRECNEPEVLTSSPLVFSENFT